MYLFAIKLTNDVIKIRSKIKDKQKKERERKRIKSSTETALLKSQFQIVSRLYAFKMFRVPLILKNFNRTDMALSEPFYSR